MEPPSKRTRGSASNKRSFQQSQESGYSGSDNATDGSVSNDGSSIQRLYNDLITKGEYRGGNGSIAGTGSAWEGQSQSLVTDSFVKRQFQDVRDDIHTTITTSAHLMSQGGAICQDWTTVVGPFEVNSQNSLLNLPMAYVTGNQLHGQANLFNQYYLCKLKEITVIFKDIVVAIEASTNVGLQVMSDVITEWKRVPKMEMLATQAGSESFHVVTDFKKTDSPDWWQDWRPATDGAVEFSFPVNAQNWLPTTLVNPLLISGITPPTDPQVWKTPGNTKRLYQHFYNFLPHSGDGGIQMNGLGTIGVSDIESSAGNASIYNIYNPYWTANTNEWMDYEFQWRARNCPNASSSVVTSCQYNMQINCKWDMAYRQTSVNPNVILTGAGRKDVTKKK